MLRGNTVPALVLDHDARLIAYRLEADEHLGGLVRLEGGGPPSERQLPEARRADYAVAIHLAEPMLRPGALVTTHAVTSAGNSGSDFAPGDFQPGRPAQPLGINGAYLGPTLRAAQSDTVRRW
jgi:hypothetical protein